MREGGGEQCLSVKALQERIERRTAERRVEHFDCDFRVEVACQRSIHSRVSTRSSKLEDIVVAGEGFPNDWYACSGLLGRHRYSSFMRLRARQRRKRD